MKSMRKKWLVPLLAFALAIGGAFATNAKIKKDFVVSTGYLSILKPCDMPVECASEGIPGCTVPGGTAYGKINPWDNHCEVPLFRP